MKIEFYSIAFMASDPVYHNGDVKALFILIVPLSFRRKNEQAKTEKRTTNFFRNVSRNSNQRIQAMMHFAA